MQEGDGYGVTTTSNGEVLHDAVHRLVRVGTLNQELLALPDEVTVVSIAEGNFVVLGDESCARF